jgi:hypothetical protein
VALNGPVPDSYWLIDGKLLAGEYPGTKSVSATRAKLTTFLDAGIRTFVDLTEARDGLTDYDAVLQDLSAERGLDVSHLRFGIRDLGIPVSVEFTRGLLATIHGEIAAGRPVYVHCWGGVGRTGTVIGCWLREQGLSGEEALARIADLRRDTPDGWKRSPEMEQQRRYVCDWRTMGARSEEESMSPRKSLPDRNVIP